ncbi:MAG: FixH family protein [Sphingobacteriales bacterium]|nr:FixH family protein [Sphingobacteriales bacterium]OJY92518.1 MAG: hypothetical protein BGP14_15135 [Sphingobacteriales bacterium 44-15]
MNWGHKLLIVILCFVGMMAYLVYKSVLTDFQLVDKDYYKNELKYQEVIDGANRASRLKTAVRIERNGNKIVVQLPDEMKGEKVSGSLWFYCAYDSKKDRKLSFSPDSNGVQSFDAASFAPGNYTVKLEWFSNNAGYYKEEKLSL